jgi:hypothetical protein
MCKHQQNRVLCAIHNPLGVNRHMIGRGLNFWKNLGSRVKQHLKQWTKPVTTPLVTGTLSDMTRSRADLIAENAMLRQQLIVLNRQVKRPQLICRSYCTSDNGLWNFA